MKIKTQVTNSPVFPTKWAEILPPGTNSQAEQLVERIYALQPNAQSSPTGSGSVQPSQANIFPPRDKVFRALKLTPPDSVRVVILGQDPYPTPGYANGLAFSVDSSVDPHVDGFPASLKCVFEEYSACFRYPTPTSGDLTPWAEQGVLLLNAALTYREDPSRKGKSHSNLYEKDWTPVVNAILQACLQLKQTVVFLAWGGKARDAVERAARKCKFTVKQEDFISVVSPTLHPDYKEPFMASEITCQLKALPVKTVGKGKFLLPSRHPSNRSSMNPHIVTRPFSGSYPFLRANAILGKQAVNWKLP